jgi:hypothetical protein
MTDVSRNEDAAFYRAALLLGLIRGGEVIRWADSVLAEDQPPAAFADIATTPPDDLTLLRERLFAVSGDQVPSAVVRRLLGVAYGDLASGRRSFSDTMTVLKQMRAFIALDRDRDLNEQLKTLGVAVAVTVPDSPERAAAERHVRDWLQQHA